MVMRRKTIPEPKICLPEVMQIKHCKGADYRHLIAEAHSQSESTICSDTFPSFDDVLPVRGESILSRLGDDNFFVQDETTSHNERTEGSNVCSDQKCDQLLSTHDEEPVRRSYEEIIFNDFSSEKLTHGDPNTKVPLFATSDPQERSSSILPDTTPPSSDNSFTERNKNISDINVATVAEAELDMLLNSLSETKVTDSSVLRSPDAQSCKKILLLLQFSTKERFRIHWHRLPQT